MDSQQINELNIKLRNADASEILSTTYHIFQDKIAFSSSLGLEDQVITHLIAEFCPKMKIFTLDTGRLFPETYELIDKTSMLYKIPVHIYFPNAQDVEEMVNTQGINLFYDGIEERKICCNTRKIKPLLRALNGLDAWVTGLRRQQAVTRQNMQIIEWDSMHNLVKINPLINWTEGDVKDFIKQNNIPYNKLHDCGFPSIGCKPCTRAVKEGEDIRSGRWWWENPEQKECGLHKQ